MLKFFNFRKNLVTNLLPSRLEEPKCFIRNIMDKFCRISVVGALEDEEIDSLEHLALFHGSSLVTCSAAWDSKIHPTDKTLLYLLFQIWLS
jgi:hypothetical protein